MSGRAPTGKWRYTAVYRDLKDLPPLRWDLQPRGCEADRAWQRAEAKVAQG